MAEDVVTQWVVALREASNRRLDQSERELSCLQLIIERLVFGPIRKKSAKYDDDAVNLLGSFQSPFCMLRLLIHSSLEFA